MEPKFQTSFIPKAPIVSAPTAAVSSRSINIFSLIATILFAAAVLTSAGLFIYKNILTNQIAEAGKSLDSARKAFEPEKIEQLVGANSRIIAAKELLNKHVALSGVLTLLQELTLKKVQFDNMKYQSRENSPPTISMDSQSETYNALAAQQEIFSKNKFIKSSEFSDFNLDENGNIKARFFATLDPTLVSYKKIIEETSLNQ
ncbi:MAG: hypothetical protein HY507_00790 [Candidatus Zambryskibacteria bacterium]|nr:hypothetical protein [Candidatus Zambryskibacteria bacterium]